MFSYQIIDEDKNIVFISKVYASYEEAKEAGYRHLPILEDINDMIGTVVIKEND